jgi:outer membrane protein assembly factor BamB
MVLAGHIHADRKLNIMGLPVLTSNMVFKKTYPIGTVKDNEIVFTKRTVGQEEKEWVSMPLADKNYASMPPVKQPEYYPINDSYRNALPRWKFKASYGIFAAPAYEKGNIVFGDYSGMLRCLNEKDGKLKWEMKLKGGVLSQPEILDGVVYVGTSDGILYSINAKTGKTLWTKDLGGEITGTGALKAGVLYIGSSLPAMYALEAKSGKEIWKSSVMDSVVYIDAKPIIEEGKVMLPVWDGYFYALDQKTGALVWKTDVKGTRSTFYSARNNRSVYANGNLLFIHPNKLSSIKVSDGTYNWTLNPQDLKIWDGFGISKDKKTIYVRHDKGGIIAYDITGEKPVERYVAGLEENAKDLCAAEIVDDGETIYFTTSTGIIGAALPKDGSIVWRHKLTNSMLNSPVVISKTSVVVTGVEGDVVLMDEKTKR